LFFRRGVNIENGFADYGNRRDGSFRAHLSRYKLRGTKTGKNKEEKNSSKLPF